MWKVLLRGEKHYKNLNFRFILEKTCLKVIENRWLIIIGPNDHANPSNIHSPHNSPSTFSHNFPSSPHKSLPDVSILDIPIAHRKISRQGARHPIANYLSYHKFCFASKINNLFIPRNIQKALNDLNWKVAVMEEMNVLETKLHMGHS